MKNKSIWQILFAYLCQALALKMMIHDYLKKKKTKKRGLKKSAIAKSASNAAIELEECTHRLFGDVCILKRKLMVILSQSRPHPGIEVSPLKNIRESKIPCE